MIQPRSFSFAVLVLLLFVRPAVCQEAAQVTPTQKITALMKSLVPESSPGVAVRVSRGDEILFDQGFGLAELGSEIKVTPETKFRIGSVTKNITAAAILKLQDEGKLKVTDSLDSVLPDFPNADKITITQLLNHSSGIPSYTSQTDFFKNVKAEVTPDEIVARFKDEPLEFEPGSDWRYNNSGYFLLGHIVAKVSGQTFDEYLENTFFAPLGMLSTGIHNSKEILKNEAYGYSFNGTGFDKALDWDMSQAGGAGAIYSTTGDLDIWVSELFAGNVVSEASLAEALSPLKIEPDNETHYGFGWSIDDQRGLRKISHGGGLQGWSSFLVHYPEHKFTIVVLHNALPSSPQINTAVISDQIAEIYLEEAMTPPPTFVVDESVNVGELENYVGRYDYGTAVMDVTIEDGQMSVHLTGQPIFPVYPIDNTHFFLKVVDAQVEFLLDDADQVTGVRHTQNGRSFIAARLPEILTSEISAETLQNYVGTYELETIGTMVITCDEKQLLAKLESQPMLPIYPTEEHTFMYKIVPATIKFSDIEENNANSISLTQAGQTFLGKRVD